MKRITCLLTALFAHGAIQAQDARVQVIHNSADAAAATVDVYINDNLALDDFAFRTATPFIDLPAGVPLSIDIAPGNSTSSAQSLYNVTTTLAANETYIVVADGIVSPTGYSPAQPFQLSVFAGGRENATSGSNTDVLVHHGSTDAPTVDVVETSVPAGTIVDNISYPSFAGYLELSTADYTLNITDASGSTVVASYLAPLSTLSLDGAALTVVASGFLDPSQNNNGAPFGLWVATAAGGNLIPLPLVETARVQVIHNSADAAAATVDVYINDNLAIDDFAFRTATPFIDLPAGVPLSIDIAPGNSTSSAQSLYNVTTTLAANETYIVVADGIVSPTGYSPAQPFQLSVFAGGRENATSGSNTDVLVHHGSTDAPTVDVVETSVPAGTIVDNISYPTFAGYLELPTADYTLNITDASGSTVVASYLAPLSTLSLDGAALTVVASGFLDPSQNNNGAPFGLWVATAAGGNLIPLPLVETARVQVIHNSADAAAATVDVYINDNLAIDDFAFRTATPFIDLPAGVPLSIDIAPGNSTSSAQSLYNVTTTLAANETYIVVADGIVSPTGYSPAQPFQLSVFAGGRENATSGSNTDVLVHHGSTDAPTVDVVETSVPAGTIVDNISYPSFAGYLELPTSDYTLNITDASGSTVVASYLAPLSTLSLDGAALTVVASGFLDPSQNNNGAPFGLWVATAAGGNLIPLPLAPLSVRGLNASAITLFPNPAKEFITIAMADELEFKYRLTDLIGREISTGTVQSNAQVPLPGLTKGTYLLQLESAGQSLVKKIMIE